MSYRTIKRVLGETNLERKCRWWFGMSLFILLSLSFFWYGRRTDTIVKDLNPKFIGPELVRAGWLEVHLSHLAEIGRIQRGQRTGGPASPVVEKRIRRRLLWRSGEEQSRAWAANSIGMRFFRKTDLNRRCRKSIAAKTHRKKSGWQNGLRQSNRAPKRHLRRSSQSKTRCSHCRSASGATGNVTSKDEDGGRSYQYYQPMYADAIVHRLSSKHQRRRAAAESPGRRFDGDDPRHDRLRTDGNRGGQESGAVCGRRRLSSGLFRCFRCGPSCGM